MSPSILLDLHRAASAQWIRGEGETAGMPLTFGDVPAEYRAGIDGAAMFDRTDRGSIEVVGPEAAAFLHRLLANTVRTLKPGEGNRNLLLSSRGKVLSIFELELEPDRVRLSTAPGLSAHLIQALDTYLFAEKLRLVDRSDRSAAIELCGARARELGEACLGARLPAADHAFIDVEFEGGSVRASALPVAGSPGVRLDGGPQLAPILWNRLRTSGATPAGVAAHDCLRVEACWPEPGVDVDENVYPQEARLERAFSLTKGCYIGQEVVAKIDTYGGLNKRICALRISHDDPLPRGSRLWRLDEGEWRDLGVITSWAYSFVLDTGMALGFVKRRHQAPGTSFRVADAGNQTELGQAVIVEAPVRSGALAVTGEFETAS